MHVRHLENPCFSWLFPTLHAKLCINRLRQNFLVIGSMCEDWSIRDQKGWPRWWMSASWDWILSTATVSENNNPTEVWLKSTISDGETHIMFGVEAGHCGRRSTAYLRRCRKWTIAKTHISNTEWNLTLLPSIYRTRNFWVRMGRLKSRIELEMYLIPGSIAANSKGWWTQNPKSPLEGSHVCIVSRSWIQPSARTSRIWFACVFRQTSKQQHNGRSEVQK